MTGYQCDQCLRFASEVLVVGRGIGEVVHFCSYVCLWEWSAAVALKAGRIMLPWPRRFHEYEPDDNNECFVCGSFGDTSPFHSTQETEVSS